ncbi:MAG: choice-of-anchor V domain-containing protein [Myxococcales bacterium]
MKNVFSAALAAAFALAPALAHANSGGITGNSKPPGCNNCHSGGAAPTVALTGPDTLAAGATGTYTLTITGGAGAYGGFNVSAENGATLQTVAGQAAQKFGAELTHSSPKPFGGGSVSWQFQAVAPGTAGTFKLYGAGNSVNGIGGNNGDQAAFDELTVTVTGGGSPADAGTVADAGTAAGDDAGTPDAGGAPDAGTGGSGPDDEAAGCGCSSAGAAAPGGALLALAALRLLRRRR